MYQETLFELLGSAAWLFIYKRQQILLLKKKKSQFELCFCYMQLEKPHGFAWCSEKANVPKLLQNHRF